MIYFKTNRSLAERKAIETKLLGSTPGGRLGTGIGLLGGEGRGRGLRHRLRAQSGMPLMGRVKMDFCRTFSASDLK
jgi:hypothetical protein